MISLFRRRAPHRAEISTRRRVRELEIVTARLMKAGFAGQYHAAFHGRGLEFAQVREYIPGDDVRIIDWNVTARTGIPHVKEFVEERDLTVLIAIDLSGSMAFGSIDRRKSDLAAELTAVLAFAANQNSDRVGLVTFDEKVRSYLPPRRGARQIERIVRQVLIDSERPARAADFSLATRFIQRVTIKRAVILLLSDFFDPAAPTMVRRLVPRHDVVALMLGDPREARLPRKALVDLLDSETGTLARVELPAAEARGAAVRAAAGADLRRRGIDAVALSTAEPYELALIRFFDSRVRRRR
ncbi:MAG TPA: DUF58 domain-containing protein [Thermoanaerobaculia bacterium]|nr:DUF58 domain-containing protein [Thermoanaerobaculia bacterium]